MPPEQASDTTAATTRRVSVLWKRRWTIVGVAMVVGTAALGMSFLQTPVYTATASVLVDPFPQGSPPVPPDMDTEKKLVASASVAGFVRRADPSLRSDVQALLEGLGVGVPVDTSILEISFTDPEPDLARRGAQGFADGYLEFRRQQLVETTRAESAALERQISEAADQLRVLQRRARDARDPELRAILTSRANTLLSGLALLDQRYQALPPLETISAGQVIQPAITPDAPSRPDHILDLVLGLLIGLILGVGVALLRDRSDDRIRDPADLASILGVRVLGTVPPLPKTRRGKEPTLIGPKARVEVVEAVRSLRSDFLFAAEQQRAKSVLVTSCRAEEGKTLTVASLGQLLAMSDKRVVMVSADLRSPRLEGAFGCDASPGLSEVLSGAAYVTDALQEIAPCLSIIPAGALPPDPAQILSGREMATLVKTLSKTADVVLLDSPPALSVPDVRVMIPACDAVLIVVDARTTTRSELAEIAHQFEWCGAQVLGAVLLNSRVDASRNYPPSPDRRSDVPVPDPVPVDG